MQRPQHFRLTELSHPVQAGMADQLAVDEDAPRRVAARLPAAGKALDRRAHGLCRVDGRGRQPARHLGMEAHGGVGLGIARHQGTQRQALGVQGRHLYTTLPAREGDETGPFHITVTGNHPSQRRQTMATLSMKTMMAALIAGSLAATAGGVAFAKSDGQAFDPAKLETRVDKRVDRALNGTDATSEQKQKISGILKDAFKDMRGLHDKRVENRKAMEAALQAPTIDPARVEAIRAEQMKVADEASKRFTKALQDAGNVLTAQQRQAFFKAWNERQGHRHG